MLKLELRLRSIVAAVGLGLLGPASALAITSAEKLGYAPDTRVVILGATNFGWTHETNAAVTTVLGQPDVQMSAEVMAVGPWFQDVAGWRRQHPDAELGVMLTLLSEGDAYRFGPAGKPHKLTGLVDEDGFLPGSLRRLEMNASPEVIELELRAQIERCLKAGIRPTHLMTHKGVLFARVDLAEIYLRLAQEYWIPAVVVELTPEMLAYFEKNNMPMEPELVDLIGKYPLPKLDELRIAPDGETYVAKRAALFEMIAQLPPGLSEVYFRPAEESNALKRLTPRWQQMVWDRDLLLDPEVRAYFQAQGIVLTDWREVMQRFDGTLPATAVEVNPAVEADPNAPPFESIEEELRRNRVDIPDQVEPNR